MTGQGTPSGSRSARPYLFVASAQGKEPLRDLISAYRSMLARPAPGLELRDLCYSAGARQVHGVERLAVVATSIEELAARLDGFAAGDESATVVRGQARARRGKLAFVFSGQGAQWVGMAGQLFAHEPVFRAVLERCDEQVVALLSWSVIEQLFAPRASSRLDDVDVLQPALFAFQVALAALWRSWGMAPDVVVGHSLGELAAAHAAGVLSLSDAARIVCARSRVTTHPCGRGAMAVIGLPAGEVEALLAPWRDRVWVAIHESPGSTVISGDAQPVDQIVAELLARDVFARRIKTLVASHTPRWDPLREPLLDLIATIQPRAATVPFQSTVKVDLDAQAADGAAMGPAYWWPNLREPVLFAQAMARLIAGGVDTFIEVGPHPILLHPILQCAKHAGSPVTALASTRRNEDERTLLLSSLAALYVQGRDIDWQAICDGTAAPVTLPSAGRERVTLAPVGAGASAPQWSRAHEWAPAPGEHPMLGRHIELQGPRGHHVWETALDPRQLPMLADHRVAGTSVLPGAAYFEMAMAASRAIFHEPWPVQKEILFEQPLAFPAGSARTIQVSASETDGGLMLWFHARRDEAGETGAGWTRVAVARAARAQADPSGAPMTRLSPGSLAALRARCDQLVAPAAHYEQLAARAIVYGPSFQGVRELARRDGEAVGAISWPAPVAHERDRYLVHPAILDACLQVSFAALPSGPDSAIIYVPVGVRGIRVSADAPVAFDAGPFYCHAVLAPGPSSAGTLSVELRVLRADESVVLEIGEVLLQQLGALRPVRSEETPVEAPGDSPESGRSVLAELMAADEGQRVTRVEALLTQHLARVLGRQAARIRADVGLHQLGLDSLMALEFRNRVRADLDVAPPLARLVVSDVTLRALARDILDQLATKMSDPARPSDGARPVQGDLGTDELTDEQVRALLDELGADA